MLGRVRHIACVTTTSKHNAGDCVSLLSILRCDKLSICSRLAPRVALYRCWGSSTRVINAVWKSAWLDLLLRTVGDIRDMCNVLPAVSRVILS